MRVVVVIGRVLDPSGIVVNRRVGRVFVNREAYITEPADRCALEVALQVKDSVGCEVVALPRGILPDADELRWAIAAGVDRAVHFTRSDAGPAELDDAASTCLLTAALVRLGGADIVMIGSRTLGTGQGQLGPRLAEALGWPQVLEVCRVSLGDRQLRAVTRSVPVGQSQGTAFRSVSVSLPCVVTVAPRTVTPRYADGVRLVNVFRGAGEEAAALESWDVDGFVESQLLVPCWERRGRRFPPVRERGSRVTGTCEEMAQALADSLRQHSLWRNP
jgi:electron transfer flavoprotein beta subunit